MKLKQIELKLTKNTTSSNKVQRAEKPSIFRENRLFLYAVELKRYYLTFRVFLLLHHAYVGIRV